MLEKADKMQLRKENEAKLKQRVQELEKYEYIEDVEVLLEMKDKEFDLLLS
jgi:predicted DNA binding CopG/RHH family protein